MPRLQSTHRRTLPASTLTLLILACAVSALGIGCAKPSPDSLSEATWLADVLDVEPEDLTKTRLATVKSLTIPDLDLRSLAGLEACVNLEELIIEGQVTGRNTATILEVDYTSLKQLTKLRSLTIRRAVSLDTTVLADLTELRHLDLDTHRPLDLTPLSNFSNLQRLRLLSMFQPLNSWEALARCNALKEVTIQGCRLTDAEAAHFLPLLSGLEILNLPSNDLQDVAFASNLLSLRQLDVRGNPLGSTTAADNIEDLRKRGVQVTPAPAGSADASQPQRIQDPKLASILRSAALVPEGSDLNSENLTGLHELRIPTNGIESLAGIEICAHLESVSLGRNPGLDLTPLSELPRLRRLSMDELSGEDSAVQLGRLTSLKALRFEKNLISDLSFCSSLQELEKLELGFCRVDTLSPLQGLLHLKELELRDVVWENEMPPDLTPLVVNLRDRPAADRHLIIHTNPASQAWLQENNLQLHQELTALGCEFMLYFAGM